MKAKEILEVILPKDIYVGETTAEVTLMEFGEYENEACAKANEVVKQLLEKYKGKVKFNFRHSPLTKIHQRSLKASEAAIAAGQSGKFWEMHNILFQNRRNLGTTSLKMYSREAGIADKTFLDLLLNSTFGNYVMADYHEGLRMGVTELPAFFINNQAYSGKISLEQMGKAIEEALKAKSKKPVKVAAKTKKAAA